MAFMMPVMKNNYDIYKDSRSRKTSECSTASSNGNPSNLSSAMGMTPHARNGSTLGQRQRLKSESFASSPSHNTHRMQMQRCQSQKTFPRNASRSSQFSPGPMSPTRSFCHSSSNGSPPKASSMHQQQMTAAGNENANGSQNDISKFHLRLVEKLRKSFRKDASKRS